MYITKEEAKKIIDKAPGMIWIDSFNRITFIHTTPRQISVDEGKKMIGKASTADYEENEIFGLILLEGVQEYMIHNIRFPHYVSK